MASISEPLPVDVVSLVNQTIESLRSLVPPSSSGFVEDEIKDAIFSAIDAINADMRTLNLAIHGGSLPVLELRLDRPRCGWIAARS